MPTILWKRLDDRFALHFTVCCSNNVPFHIDNLCFCTLNVFHCLRIIGIVLIKFIDDIDHVIENRFEQLATVAFQIVHVARSIGIPVCTIHAVIGSSFLRKCIT